MNGTAQRTEKPIISETPGALLISTCDTSKTMARDIGKEISQNSRQPFKALIFRTSLPLILMIFN